MFLRLMHEIHIIDGQCLVYLIGVVNIERRYTYLHYYNIYNVSI